MTNLRNLLTEAVPELPAPPDRLAEVGARLRRRRRSVSAIAVGLVVLATGAAVAVPNLLQSNPPGRPGDTPVVVGTDGCPEPGTFHGPLEKDGPGPLVPEGATDVALCEVPSPLPGGVPEEPPPTRVLTAGVDEIVRVLNEMPGRKRYSQLIREREIAEGRPDPGPMENNITCTGVGYPFDVSLRLRYPDREPVFVLLDRNCGSARVGDITRHWWPRSPLVTFFTNYRDQLATTTAPLSVPTPTCATAIGTESLRRETYRSGPADGIGLNREGTNVFLPNPLVAAAVCRYTVDSDGARLAGTKIQRGDLDSLRDAINRQFETDGQDGPKQAMVECGNPAQPLPQRMDVVNVSDATGAISEIWLYRAPCFAAIRSGYAGLAPFAAFVSEVDTMLR